MVAAVKLTLIVWLVINAFSKVRTTASVFQTHLNISPLGALQHIRIVALFQLAVIQELHV